MDALGRGRGGSPPSAETRRAAVAAAAALLREPTRAADVLRRAGATHALMVGALASTVSIGVADAETHETTLRIVATTAISDPEGANLAGLLADRGGGDAVAVAVAGNAARAPFLRATFDALLSSRATVRIAACACITAVVNRRDPAAAARLVDAGVAEHLYETLRDRAGAPARDAVRVPLGYANRHDQTHRDGADRSETTFAALRCLRAVAEACPPGAFARRFASGVDPTATTLRDAADADDARIQTAAAAFVRRAAEDIDPGNVPPDAAVRLMMLLADVYERAPVTVQIPATVRIHTRPPNDGELDSDDPRAEARGALAALLRWESLGDETRACVGRKTFGTMAADLARDLRALVDDRASPATRDAPSSEIPRFMREVLERHARPAELSSVADVLRAHDVPGLLVASLRRVDALTRADPTRERNAVECICATAAVLGVVLGDDDGDDDGDGGVGDERRDETRPGGPSIPGGDVDDAVRAERDDARDVRRELAEGLMRADAVGATLWALSALLDRHRASSRPSPPAGAYPGHPEERHPVPDLDLDLDLEPSGVLWSFLAVVLGALGPDVVPRTIREEMHRPRRWPTGPEWSPAGVFAAFAAAPIPGESPGDRRDGDVAGYILVACLFARIAREPTRDGSYSATGLTDGDARGDGLLRECAGTSWTTSAARGDGGGGGRRSDPFSLPTSAAVTPRFCRWWCGTSAFASAPRWTRRSNGTSWRTTRGRSVGSRRPATRAARARRRSWRWRNPDPSRRRRGRGIGYRARGGAHPGRRRGAPTPGS